MLTAPPLEPLQSLVARLDAKLMFPGHSIEIIAHFAFHGPRGVIDIPTVVAGRCRGVPLGSPEAWLAAYHLLERPAKRDLLLGHLRAKGHDDGVVERLLAEPLLMELADMLAALGGSDGASSGGAPASSTT